MEYEKFYELLLRNGFISEIWGYILDMLNNELKDNKNKEDFLKLSTIYFSLIDDGNIAMSLDKDRLEKKWSSKLEGIHQLLSEKEDPDEKEKVEQEYQSIKEESLKVIKDKLSDIQESNYPEVIGSKRIFDIEDNWLYIKKYNQSRKSIKERIIKLFEDRGDSISDESLDFLDHTINPKDNKKHFELSDGQKKIVKEGLNKNLLVTGGPGTGKTTSVLFTLVNLLLKRPDTFKKIYMVAPSGKASSRIKESVQEGIQLFEESYKDSHKEVFELLDKVQESTIHRLLSVTSSGAFRHNAHDHLPEDAIYVIDEASMIDICLFGSLLEAIPDNAKVFILGDKNQLPSVESGAVFAELLKMKELKNNKVELDESIRFSKDTYIYRLATEINENKTIAYEEGAWENYDKFEVKPTDSSKCPIYFYRYDDNERCRTIIDKLVDTWGEKYYSKLKEAATDLDPNDEDALKSLFKLTKDAKILSAENEGWRGVKYINLRAKRKYINRKGIEDGPGQLMMINTNNPLLQLYNGDSGILVTFIGDSTIYFMTDKRKDDVKIEGKIDNGAIFVKGGFTFYPLTAIKKDEIDLAFAITIHKSQGSDYNNILVILPNKAGHPLLNRQIVYTAITRTKGNTYILSSKERLDEAKEHFIERDTNIAD